MYIPDCVSNRYSYICQPRITKYTHFPYTFTILSLLLAPSVPPLSFHPSALRLPNALLNIHSSAVTLCSPSSATPSSPSIKFSSKISLLGRQKYTRLYLSQTACLPGGGTTLWMLLLNRPPENFTSASPRLTMQCPGSGRTYAQPSWHRPPSDAEQGEEDEGGRGATEGGSRTCRPPRRFNRMVTEPKSVCSPSATEEETGCWGGARTKRIWSPEGDERAWRLRSPPSCLTSVRRARRSERRDVTSMHIACEEVMYPLNKSLC